MKKIMKSIRLYSLFILGCLLLLSPVKSNALKVIPKERIPSDAIYYAGHYYKLYTDQVTYYDAKKICDSMGGYLVDISSLEEKVFLKSILPQTEDKGYAFWCGYLRAKSQGNYTEGQENETFLKNIFSNIKNTVEYRVRESDGQVVSTNTATGFTIWYYHALSLFQQHVDVENDVISYSLGHELRMYESNSRDVKHGYICEWAPIKYLEDAMIAGVLDEYTYYGNPIVTNASLYINENFLDIDEHYTLSYENNDEIGRASVIFNGNGEEYCGVIKKNFLILPQKISGVSVESNDVGKVAIGWKSVEGVKNYQIQYYDVDNPGNVKSTTATAATTISDLRKDAQYVFQVRAFSQKGEEVFYGPWSDKANVRILTDEFTAKYKSTVSKKVKSIDFIYRDTFFQDSSNSLNKELAKASLALSAAAYNSKYIQEVLKKMHFSVEIENYNKKVTRYDNDSVAYAIGTKTIYVNDETYNLVVAVIRGTGTNAEWYSNFNVGPGSYLEEHMGFKEASKKVSQSLKEKMSGKHKNILWITGHSRGAAVANIVAQRLNGTIDFGIGNYNILDEERVYAYTFATPTVSSNADTSLKNIHNFCNSGDLVTQLPLKAWGYDRHGRTYSINKNKIKQIKKKFKTFTGVSYSGYLKKPQAFNALSKWIPSKSAYYTKKKGVSPHDILDAAAAFLGNQSKSEKKYAAKTLIKALSNKQLPAKVAILYLGEDNVVKLLKSSSSKYKYKASNPSKYIGHAHSIDLYKAWMDVL